MTMIAPEVTEVKEEIDFKLYTKAEYDAAIADKDETISRLRQLNQEFRQDGDRIASALRQEASDRDWCESYNTFAEEVNSGTKHLKLESLEHEYTVEVTVTRTQTQRISVSIYATNDDAANDEFYSSQEDYADTHLRDDEWQDESVEYEVERVDEV
jgi:hypothetical protein